MHSCVTKCHVTYLLSSLQLKLSQGQMQNNYRTQALIMRYTNNLKCIIIFVKIYFVLMQSEEHKALKRPCMSMVMLLFFFTICLQCMHKFDTCVRVLALHTQLCETNHRHITRVGFEPTTFVILFRAVSCYFHGSVAFVSYWIVQFVISCL